MKSVTLNEVVCWVSRGSRAAAVILRCAQSIDTGLPFSVGRRRREASILA
jgi:hypothetical protein